MKRLLNSLRNIMAEQGAHYKLSKGEQHHERAIRMNMNWYQGNITKYAERAPHKGQMVEDLIKVLDYTCMWLASRDKEIMPVMVSMEQINRIDQIIRKIVPPTTAIGPERYEPHEGARRNTEEK
jgi:hypothetical protein